MPYCHKANGEQRHFCHQFIREEKENNKSQASKGKKKQHIGKPRYSASTFNIISPIQILILGSIFIVIYNYILAVMKTLIYSMILKYATARFNCIRFSAAYNSGVKRKVAKNCDVVTSV